MRFECFQGDGKGQGSLGCKIHANPFPFCGRRIWVGLFDNPGYPHDLLADDAVIKKGQVAVAHGVEIFAGLEIAHARPSGAAV